MVTVIGTAAKMNTNECMSPICGLSMVKEQINGWHHLLPEFPKEETGHSTHSHTTSMSQDGSGVPRGQGCLNLYKDNSHPLSKLF